MDRLQKKLNRCKRSTTIAMIGKYVDLEDSYKSLNEALYHAGIINGARVNIEYIDSEKINNKYSKILKRLMVF